MINAGQKDQVETAKALVTAVMNKGPNGLAEYGSSQTAEVCHLTLMYLTSLHFTSLYFTLHYFTSLHFTSLYSTLQAEAAVCHSNLLSYP